MTRDEAEAFLKEHLKGSGCRFARMNYDRTLGVANVEKGIAFRLFDVRRYEDGTADCDDPPTIDDLKAIVAKLK